MKKVLAALIRFYQRYISGLKPPSCRFYPTCSAYALQAIERFGALKGGILSIWRILRCSPLCQGGIDPVPEKFALPPWRWERHEKQHGNRCRDRRDDK